MIAVIVIVLGVVLRLLPADVQSFVITTPEKETVRYARQSDGGWEATPMKKDGERFSIKGTQLLIGTGGGMFPLELTDVLGITKDTDWKTIDTVKMGDKVMSIQRQADGVTIAITPNKQSGSNDRAKRYQVRWEFKEK